MSGGVSTSSDAINKAIMKCESVEEYLRDQSSRIQKQYNAASSGWSDAKYKEVGSIINEAISALQAPLKELKGHKATLRDLKKKVDEYESI